MTWIGIGIWAGTVAFACIFLAINRVTTQYEREQQRRLRVTLERMRRDQNTG